MFTSLQQCHACRLTWFPQGRSAACPACGGTKLGGTFELFHLGLVLIALGSVGWLFRHGPLSERAAAAEPAAIHARHATHATENVERVPAKKSKSDKVNVKRRPKKAKTRSKHVQR